MKSVIWLGLSLSLILSLFAGCGSSTAPNPVDDAALRQLSLQAVVLINTAMIPQRAGEFTFTDHSVDRTDRQPITAAELQGVRDHIKAVLPSVFTGDALENYIQYITGIADRQSSDALQFVTGGVEDLSFQSILVSGDSGTIRMQSHNEWMTFVEPDRDGTLSTPARDFLNYDNTFQVIKINGQWRISDVPLRKEIGGRRP